MEKIKSISNVLVNVIVTIIVLVSLFFTFSVINSEKYKYSTPGIWIFGFVEAVDQDSPLGINKGDMLVINTSSLDNLKKDDVVTYMSAGNKFLTDRVAGISDGSHAAIGQNSISIEADRLIGKYIFKVPYAGYILGYVKTTPGLIVCIIAPCAVLVVYISILLADMSHNSSKHRKRIVRKRKRRNKRYLKEGLQRDRRAVI